MSSLARIRTELTRNETKLIQVRTAAHGSIVLEYDIDATRPDRRRTTEETKDEVPEPVLHVSIERPVTRQ
jgi:hypothetical protein